MFSNPFLHTSQHRASHIQPMRQAERTRTLRTAAAATLLFCLILLPAPAGAYSVQTHEQLIDLTWKAHIVPLLEKRFPNLTPAQIKEAHSYAYGGAAIQDLGYYPFGNPFFSDLTHYVRSGDFVDSLLRNARTPDELAFAIGALSHYIGDSVGHSEATNPSVAVQFPHLAQKYGPSVSYEENPHDHVRTEFAFDINEIAKRRFAPRRYLNHVGLNVSTDLLARAFFETYGLQLKKTVHVERTNLFGYTFSVRRFLPRIAYAETVLHRHSLPPDPTKDAEFEKLKADLLQAGLDNKWGPWRGKAGIGTYTLAGFIFIAPRIGPLAMLAIRGPNETAEALYVKSLNDTTERLRLELLHLRVPPPAVGPPPVRQTTFPNLDLDTGRVVRPGSYRLTDETYAKLLHTITREPSRHVPIGLQQDLFAFYADPSAPDTTKRNPTRWAQVQSDLATLHTMPTTPQP